MLARAITGGVLLFALTFARLVHADPFVGEARVDVEDGDLTAARRRGAAEARRSALQAAIASLALERAEAANDVMATPEPWTAAYRVLEQRTEGSQLVLRLEVDIDVARLHKRLLPPRPGRGSGYRLAAIRPGSSCPAIDETVLVEPLRALGVVVDEPQRPALQLDLECEVRGKVAFTYLHAATARVVATVDGQPVARTTETTFGDSEQASVLAALHAALSDVAGRLAAKSSGQLELVVEHPWPAAHVRELVSTLSEAVLGVRSVTLAGIESGGAVRLRIDGDLDASELGRRLADISFPRFQLVDFSIKSAHAAHVRLE